MVFLVLYVDDILLMRDNVKLLTELKDWLATQFKIKDLGNANYVLGIQIFRDRESKTLALSQVAYINKVFTRFLMKSYKKGLMPTFIKLFYRRSSVQRHRSKRGHKTCTICISSWKFDVRNAMYQTRHLLRSESCESVLI